MDNYFAKIFIRQLFKKSRASLVNLLGLSIGIGASLLVYLIIRNEMEYDAYQSKRDRIYRVVATTTNRSNGEVIDQSASVPAPLPDGIRLDFPDFEKTGAIMYAGTPQVYVGGKTYEEEKRFLENTGVFYAEPALFDILDFHWLSGNATSLAQPNTVVLSKTVASKYFGNWESAVGNTIKLWSWRQQYRVVGVFDDLPPTTDIPIRVALSYSTIRRSSAAAVNNPNRWKDVDKVFRTECFLLASPAQNLAAVQRQLPFFVEKYYREKQDHAAVLTILGLQPMKEIHLDQRFDTFSGDAIPLPELWSLGLVGVFLIAMACINFINLATAQSVNRAKEIGIRKVLGSSRRKLVAQLLAESGVLTLMAVILGSLVALLALPTVSSMIQKPIALDISGHPGILIVLFGLLTVITCLAGFYPALVISRFDPIEAIRSRISARAVGGLPLRRILVVFQFVIAQLLIIGTIVVVLQMNFFRSHPMGFEKHAIAIIDLPSDSADQQKYPYLKEEMMRIPGVIDASYCMDPPSSDEKITDKLFFDNQSKKTDMDIELQFADTSYLNTFGIKLVAGRLPFPSDTTREFLVNETAVRLFGLKSNGEILGKTLAFNSREKYPIVGVIHDFNSRSLRDPILPLALASGKKTYTDLAVRIDPGKLMTAMSQVQQVFSRVMPAYLYDPVFFEDSIMQFYQKETVVAKMFRIFAGLAIFISCLGLFGLISFISVQKTKEIGIRKILGASVQSILFLFSREFILLVIIAFGLSAPVGYFFMHRWLSGFYNHVDIGWTVPATALVCSVLVAFITVGWTSLKAAMANPAESLRSE